MEEIHELGFIDGMSLMRLNELTNQRSSLLYFYLIIEMSFIIRIHLIQ